MESEPTVKLNLTVEQYRNLLLVTYLGTAMVNTARDELLSETEDGGSVELPPGVDAAADGSQELMQLLLAQATQTGAVGDVERGDDGELYPGEELENMAVDCADLYGESIFWTQLAHNLAERDLGQLRSQNRPVPDGMDENELLQNLTEMYLEEFAENGLENLMIPLLDENEMSHPN